MTTAAAPARASTPFRRSGPDGRIPALDAARAVAVFGMIVVNVGPRAGEGVADVLHRLPLGRASLLFVVLAGLGISLLTRRARRFEAPLPWAALAWRAGLLLAGGLALQLLDHRVSVILPTYAVLFVLAVPFLRASDRTVLAAALGSVVLGPLVWIAVQRAQGVTFDARSPVLTDPPGDILHGILLSSPYPVVTWLGPFLLGMWLGRQDLRRRSLQVRMIVAGAVTTVAGRAISLVLVATTGEPDSAVGFDRLVTSVAHSQMPLWLLSGTGSALLVLGAMLRMGDLVDRWLRPLVSTGQLALSVYVGHLVALDLFVRPGPGGLLDGVLISLTMSALAIILATAWRRHFEHGPLETLLRPPWTTRPAGDRPARPALPRTGPAPSQ